MHANLTRRVALLSSAIALAFLSATLPTVAVAQGEYEQTLLAQKATPVFAQIVIYDVLPGREAEFEKLIALGAKGGAKGSEFINDRVLKNIDAASPQYATYTKFGNAGTAQALTTSRIAAVRALLRRDAESHLAQMDKVYTPKGELNAPNGRELGTSVGQIAHLGLFLPTPSRVEDYYAALYKVKVHTLNRKPRGYIGDELLIETQRNTAQLQAPYTPRPREATRLSFNYGEYKKLEDAEDSYVDRTQETSPEMITLERTFYSALQVPNRFYIFKVIGNS